MSDDIRTVPGRAIRLSDENGVETWLDFQTGQLVTFERERRMHFGTSLLSVVEGQLQQREITYDAPDDETISLDLRGEHATYLFFLRADEETRRLICYCGFGSKVPEARRAAVAEAIARANHGLIIGCFEMSFADGQLRFRVGTDVEGAELSAAMVDNIFLCCLGTCDRYHDALMAVMFGGAEPAAAIAEAEGA